MGFLSRGIEISEVAGGATSCRLIRYLALDLTIFKSEVCRQTERICGEAFLPWCVYKPRLQEPDELSGTSVARAVCYALNRPAQNP